LGTSSSRLFAACAFPFGSHSSKQPQQRLIHVATIAGGHVELLHAHPHLTHMRTRWRHGSLCVLLGVQVFIIFGAGPLLALGTPISPPVAAFGLLTVIFFVVVASPSLVPTLVIVAALLFNAAAAVSLRWAGGADGATPRVFWLDAIGVTLSIAGLSWVVIQLVFAPGSIDRYRIVGAVVLYLNIALLFDAFYRLILELSPGAFGGVSSGHSATRWTGELMYFSMTTLTTVGYGDIVPIHPIARSLSNLEGLLGQLYPAIILARIMTLYQPRR
jgi:voltage-gated potassium channel Kch